MQDSTDKTTYASPPDKSEYRHFFEKRIDGCWVPVTFHRITWGDDRQYSAYEHGGRTYQPYLIEAMVRAGVLIPAMTPSQRAEYNAAA